MNEAYHYPIIYWNTANLIVDSASDEEYEGGTTAYGKIGVAIANMQKQGIEITLPLINDVKFSFTPDEKNNRIIYALKGMNGIGDEVAKAIIEHKPYTSLQQFCELMVGKDSELNLVGNAQMIKLIKGGCFTELHNKDRKETMLWFIKNRVLSPITSLSLTQLPAMKEMGLIPEELDLAYRMVNFKKYVLSDEGLIEKYIDPNKKMVKRGYHDGRYILDNQSQKFFSEHFTEDSVVRVQGNYYVISEKLFIKEVDSYIKPLKDWFSNDDILKLYNDKLVEGLLDKHAKGTIEHWNMEALTYYDGDHELVGVKDELYGIVDFFELSEEPEVYDWYTRYINGFPKKVPKHKIVCIAGTVLDSEKTRHTISLLTKTGVVSVKLNKGHFAYYSKRISQVGEDGKKHVIEESWLKRGNLIRCVGVREGEQFKLKNYNDTIYQHTLNLITEVHEDGTLTMQMERTKLGEAED